MPLFKEALSHWEPSLDVQFGSAGCRLEKGKCRGVAVKGVLMWRGRLQPIRESLLEIGLGWSRRIELQKNLRFGAPFSSGPAGLADPEEVRVFVIAGEPSGDVIGSRLMASLRHLSPKPLRFSGVGGC